MLSTTSETNHLLGLILELLQGSSEVINFKTELNELLLDKEQYAHIRFLSYQSLSDISSWDYKQAFNQLLSQKDKVALELASRMVEKQGVTAFDRVTIQALLQYLSKLYPNSETESSSRSRVIGSKYFITQLITSFGMTDIKWFLNKLSKDIKCICEPDRHYHCYCKNGISKIIGRLLDRLFELDENFQDAELIWAWTKDLKFSDTISKEQSNSVRILHYNDSLRQKIQSMAFNNVNTQKEILDLRRYFSGYSYGHSGLHLSQKDILKLSDESFSLNNQALWGAFFHMHDIYNKEKGIDKLRSKMRVQASQKPEFMHEWAMKERSSREHLKRERRPRFRFERTRKSKQKKIVAKNLEHLKENRSLIESGQHMGWLRLFADHYLTEPNTVLEHVDDIDLPERALRNCVPFLEPSIPTLSELSQLASQSRRPEIIRILHAACLAIFRETGTLRSLSKMILQALKTDINMHYSDISQEESDAFESEVNRYLFITEKDLEEFVRTYIEPQLNVEGGHYSNVDWLRYKPEFTQLKSHLPIEWLIKFPNLRIHDVSTLFNLCVEFGDKHKLKKLINKRCNEIYKTPPITEEDLKKKEFWFIRSFFLLAMVMNMSGKNFDNALTHFSLLKILQVD
ncbi:MAG: hypothetical protein COA63_001420 [Methylophaga sp.]|nr:hypothetical protein [Methylophaga sp.]